MESRILIASFATDTVIPITFGTKSFVMFVTVDNRVGHISSILSAINFRSISGKYSCIGIICFIATSLLDLEYAVLISVIVGITNMIPYFGPFIGAVPGVVLYLCIKPLDAVVFVIMIFILQQFDGWVLGPKILGDSTGLSPLWVIFGITVGGAYGGVIGMFLGVPVVAVAAYLLNQAVSGVLKKKRIDIS